MEHNKIFLESNRDRTSIDKESTINIELERTERPLPTDSVSDAINLNDIYNAERDACNKYRLIFTINPICTNVLHNMKTEIVKGEGTDRVYLLRDNVEIDKTTLGADKAYNTSFISHKQAIADTEYTHKDLGDFVYHCGVDIFNNHFLRATDFNHVPLYSANESDDIKKVFNTIKDYQKNDSGQIITHYPINNSAMDGSRVVDLENDTMEKTHLYQKDNILPLTDAYSQKIREENGWVGFTNPTNIRIPLKENKNNLETINKLMNNNKPCEFIDMYPDRSLYSFTPKLNKFRHRLEYNWDYVLTYPYENDYDKFNELNDNTINAIKVISVEEYPAPTLNPKVILKTYFNPNVKTRDYIHLYVKENGEYRQIGGKILVSGVDNRGKYGVVIESRYLESLGEYKEDENKQFFLKKVINNTEAIYYLRKFKKLPCFEGHLDDLNDFTIDINDVLDRYTENFHSEINKLGFSENIYGDEISQIVFTDDINLDRLKNNLGKPIDKLYLTIIKRNKGHEKWYNATKAVIDDPDGEIEFSHCFSQVDSGFDLPTDEEYTDYNVHRIHNVDTSAWDNETSYKFTQKILNIPEKVEVINSDITIDNIDTFYGDMVEFDGTNCEETIIEDIYFRFNTQQRETSNKEFRNLWEDVIKTDDFDLEGDGFQVVSREVNNVYDLNGIVVTKVAANICPEGYYYKANYPIIVRKYNDIAKSEDVVKINFNTEDAKIETVSKKIGSQSLMYKEVTITSPKDYGFIIGQVFSFYEIDKPYLQYKGILNGISGLTMTLQMLDDKLPDDTTKLASMGLVMAKNPIDFNAVLSIGGKNAFVWKDLVKTSELNVEDELFDLPFANQAFYIHKNINFFLRRQDPFNDDDIFDDKGKNSYGLRYRQPANILYSNPVTVFGKYIGSKFMGDIYTWIYDNKDIENCF